MRIDIPDILEPTEAEFFEEEIGAERVIHTYCGERRRVLIDKYAEEIEGEPYLVKKYNIYSSEGLTSVSEVCKPILSRAERDVRSVVTRNMLGAFARDYINNHGIEAFRRNFKAE